MSVVHPIVLNCTLRQKIAEVGDQYFDGDELGNFSNTYPILHINKIVRIKYKVVSGIRMDLHAYEQLQKIVDESDISSDSYNDGYGYVIVDQRLSLGKDTENKKTGFDWMAVNIHDKYWISYRTPSISKIVKYIICTMGH